MSEYVTKLAAALPKGDPNGWADEELADELWEAKIRGRYVQPRVAVIVYDAREAKVDKDGNRVLVLQIRRTQPVTGTESLRAAERILHDEYAATHGDVLPFELVSLSKATFAGLPRDTDEIDQAEEAERETMTADDELRRHLERVHGVEGAGGLTAEEAATRHATDHEPDVLPEEMRHDVSWIGWTRADIEAAADAADDDPASARMRELAADRRDGLGAEPHPDMTYDQANDEFDGFPDGGAPEDDGLPTLILENGDDPADADNVRPLFSGSAG